MAKSFTILAVFALMLLALGAQAQRSASVRYTIVVTESMVGSKAAKGQDLAGGAYYGGVDAGVNSASVDFQVRPSVGDDHFSSDVLFAARLDYAGFPALMDVLQWGIDEYTASGVDHATDAVDIDRCDKYHVVLEYN